MREEPFPCAPGLEVVGVVVGARVTGVWPGAHVMTMLQRFGGIAGAAAAHAQLEAGVLTGRALLCG